MKLLEEKLMNILLKWKSIHPIAVVPNVSCFLCDSHRGRRAVCVIVGARELLV